MLIEFLKNVHVHEDKERVDEDHLDKLIPIDKVVDCAAVLHEKQITQSWKHEPKLLAEKQSETNYYIWLLCRL